jgi:predicted TIM-barrel fold metal-dependent hydrolase
MTVIDADTHVIETERTWSFMREEEQGFRPLAVAETNGGPRRREFWIFEGRAFPKIDPMPGTSGGTREMTDIPARLAHMDELGVDIHILYPSIFTRPLTHRPEAQVAICRSYNRWLGEIWAQEKKRLPWVAVLPMMSMEESLPELHWAKEHGACGIFTHGVEEWGHRPSDPFFFPLYREASKLNVPICFHAGTGAFFIQDLWGPGFQGSKLPVLAAFHDLISNRVPEKFPDLRWGFLETSAAWLPYAYTDLGMRFEKEKRKAPGPELLRENRMYVACQTTDDLPYILEQVGEENIVIGSDYGHNDTSSELQALRKLKTNGQVDASTVDKIMGENARRLYGI